MFLGGGGGGGEFMKSFSFSIAFTVSVLFLLWATAGPRYQVPGHPQSACVCGWTNHYPERTVDQEV